MSETTAPATPAPAEAPKDGATPAPEEVLGDPGKKALSEERQARKAAEQSAAALQAQLNEFKRAQMTDLEKAQTLAAEAQSAAETARAEALRWRIAAKHGISDEDAETFLTGKDEETLTRQAERLSSLAATASTTPKPDRTQGGTGQPHALNSDSLEQALRDKLGL